jgi:hypothetical protein
LIQSTVDLFLKVQGEVFVTIDIVHVHVAFGLHVLEDLGSDTAPGECKLENHKEQGYD